MSIELNNWKRKQKILHVLLIAILSATMLVAILLLIFDHFFTVWFPQYKWTGEAQIYAHIGASTILAVSLVLLFLNRMGGTASAVARYAFVTMLFVVAAISDTPQHVVGRGLITFSLPIILTSVLLDPLRSFMSATIGSLIISIIDVQLLGNPPNPFAIITFYVIALISWLVTKMLEEAIQDTQKLNKRLSVEVEAQHQDLLQIVNDFAFLADSHENAIELFGPDGELVFANKKAIAVHKSMDDRTRAVRQDIIEKAWAKNLYTRVEFPAGFKVDIISSLIDTEGGTYLLLQAIRLPDGESKRSLEDWQQKLEAANNLPENAEFDSHTGKMRILTSDNGKVSKKVLFELIAGALVIEHPADRTKIKFDLENLAALAIRD